MKILMILLTLFSNYSFCEGKDIFAQKDNLSFEKTEIKQEIEQNNDCFNYMSGDMFDYSTLKAQCSNYNNFFPSHSFILLHFINVLPHKNIFLNDNFLLKTDEYGNAEKPLYLDIIDFCLIQLKDDNRKIVESDTILINNINLIECRGIKPMKCKGTMKN